MELDNLTDEQNHALSRFREFTHIDSVETCRQYLSAHEWNVERAIETALVSNADIPSESHTDVDEENFRNNQISSTPQTSTDQPRPVVVPATTNNRSVQLFQLIFSFLYSFCQKLQSFVPWTLIHLIFSFFRSLFWSGRPVDPIEEIDRYYAYFDQQYGTQHPTFYRGRLADVLRDARREVRLVFIYLHEKNSATCDRFCREVICQEALRSIIGDNFLWSVSSDTQEGALINRMLHNSTFPCIFILAHHDSQAKVQFKLSHYNDSDECLAEILNGVQIADQTLQFNRERRDNRSSRDRLLEEQNEAYLESVRADQEKAEQRKREELERKQFEENQQRMEEEKQKKLQEFVTFRDQFREKFSSEPSADENDTIQVSIRLPTSKPVRRRFRRSDPAKNLFEFAWTQENVPNHFELLWGFPRKRYQYEQIGDDVLLADVISGKTETCFLEQIDDEK